MINLKKIVHSWSEERWAIGFVRNSFDQILDGEDVLVEWIQDDNKKRWFADPFILDENEKEIIILAEEVNKNYKQGKKGRISRLTINKNNYKIKDVEPILELDTHLSFPVIYRANGNVYIYPENSESGQVKLYRYDDVKRTCTFERVLCDEPLADAVMTECFGSQLLFATKKPNVNGSKLLIYTRGEDSYFSSKECVIFEENIARMAGQFIEHNGKVYRPTQECNFQYGHAVTLQEVMKDNNWHFREVRRLYSSHPKLNIGMHTLNEYNGLIVTDALGFDRMWLRKFLKFLHLLH